MASTPHSQLPPGATRVLSFRAWIRRFRDEQTARGDLARDVVADREWPPGRGSLHRYVVHLYSIGADPEAVETLREAWTDYEAYRANPPDPAPVNATSDRSPEQRVAALAGVDVATMVARLEHAAARLPALDPGDGEELRALAADLVRMADAIQQNGFDDLPAAAGGLRRLLFWALRTNRGRMSREAFNALYDHRFPDGQSAVKRRARVRMRLAELETEGLLVRRGEWIEAGPAFPAEWSWPGRTTDDARRPDRRDGDRPPAAPVVQASGGDETDPA